MLAALRTGRDVSAADVTVAVRRLAHTARYARQRAEKMPLPFSSEFLANSPGWWADVAKACTLLRLEILSQVAS